MQFRGAARAIGSRIFAAPASPENIVEVNREFESGKISASFIDQSMPTQTKTFSVTIRAPQEEVFAYVSDLTRHPEWSGGLLRVEARTAGQVGVGSKYVSHGELLN